MKSLKEKMRYTFRGRENGPQLKTWIALFNKSRDRKFKILTTRTKERSNKK